MIQTNNFNPIDDPKLLCTCNHKLCDERSVKQYVLDKIQLIRYEVNRGMLITSGGRCPYHPDEVHRTTPADHQNCVALDVKVSGGVQRAEMVNLGIKYGATAIGVAKTFVHLGWRENTSLVMWVY